MRHRVEIQTVVETRDAHGGVSRTWNTDAIRWASIEPLTGREYFQAAQINSAITHKVIMRDYALTPKQRLVYDSRTFEIQSVKNIVELGAQIEVLCTENAV